VILGLLWGVLRKTDLSLLTQIIIQIRMLFARKRNRKIFAVGDGLGSQEYSGAVSRWMTKKIVEELKDLNDIQPEWILQKNARNFSRNNKEIIGKYKKPDATHEGIGATTIVAVKRDWKRRNISYFFWGQPCVCSRPRGRIWRRMAMKLPGMK